MKGALVEYEKANAKPIVVQLQLAKTRTILDYDPLPDINLLTKTSIVTSPIQGKMYDVLKEREEVELREVNEWLTSEQVRVSR